MVILNTALLVLGGQLSNYQALMICNLLWTEQPHGQSEGFKGVRVLFSSSNSLFLVCNLIPQCCEPTSSVPYQCG